MLYIILAESSLELIPKQICNHPSVVSYSKKFKKNSSNTLLDNSWHFGAMKGLDNEIKRGRPDIIHLTLLSLCTTPVFYENKIKVFVHTVNNEVIFINNNNCSNTFNVIYIFSYRSKNKDNVDDTFLFVYRSSFCLYFPI